jgi:acetolactate synthase-1/3 small subunit
MNRHVLSVLVDNAAGVLERIAGLISRRGFNIDSLSVGETDNPGLSRMTILITCSDHDLDQMVQQLSKLICVKKVLVLPSSSRVIRELLLLKVSARADNRAEVLSIASVFRANVIDVSPDSLILEITGDEEKSEALLQVMREYGILEVARTGATALARGSESIHEAKESEDIADDS